MKRIEGLVEMEEFHNQAEFLQVSKYLTLADILVPCNAFFFFKTIKDTFIEYYKYILYHNCNQVHNCISFDHCLSFYFLFYKEECYYGKFIFQQFTLIQCKVNIL